LDEPINTVGFMFDSYRCGETANGICITGRR
jgi:hypothetical protein